MSAARLQSVERQGRSASMDKSPHRQFNRPALPVGVVSVQADLPRVAERALAKVREVRRARSCGTLVFAAPDGRVFALRSESVSADTMLLRNPEWLICEYAGRHSNGAAAPCPVLDDIAEDLAFHFADMGKELRDIPEQLDLWGFHGAFAEALSMMARIQRSRRRYMASRPLIVCMESA